MGAKASQISSITTVYPTVYSGADQRIHQSSTSLAFVSGIHRGSVNSPHKGPVTRKMFSFDDVIMNAAIVATTIGQSPGAGAIVLKHIGKIKRLRMYWMCSNWNLWERTNVIETFSFIGGEHRLLNSINLLPPLNMHYGHLLDHNQCYNQ